jgi:hypothetical protein
MRQPCPAKLPLAARAWEMRWRLALWLAVVTTLGSAELALAVAVPEEPASPAAALQLREATARMKDLADLREQVDKARWVAQSVAAAGESLRKTWHVAEQADANARTSVQQASDCLDSLREELTTSDAAIDALLLTIRRSHKAVETIARSTSSQIGQLARESDAAFDDRAQAEHGLTAQKQQQEKARIECRIALRDTNFRIVTAFDRTQDIASGARQLPEQLRDLGGELDQMASRAAAAARWMQFRAEPVSLSAGQRIRALEQMLGEQTSAHAPKIEASAIETLGGAEADFQTRAAELARAQDAATFLDLISPQSARNCNSAACRLFKDQRAAQAERERDANLRLAATRARLTAANMSFEGLLTPAQVALYANAGFLQRVGAALEPALAEMAEATSIAQAAIDVIAIPAKAAYVEAQAKWEEAYVLAFGHAPPPAVPFDDVAKKQETIRRSYYGASENRQEMSLIGHVYGTFSLWDTEQRNFGAYTYVLFRSAPEQEAPDVRRSYQQLLAAIRRIPAAHLVHPGEESGFNLFCVPGREITRAGTAALEVVYEPELGNQLKLRAQGGILTRPEILNRLAASPGPFLITFPTRIADARSTSPALFADLAGYPADAIADLVGQYMTGLLTDFPRQQASWKPPRRQRVALLMIHVASEAGELLLTPVSAAHARPVPR